MTIVVHGGVEGAVTDVAGDVQSDVVETEADDTPTTPVPVQLRIVGGAPHRDVEPAENDAQIAEENLVDDLDLDAQSIEVGESFGVGLERHDAVAGDISRVYRDVYLAMGERLQCEATDRLDDVIVAQHDSHGRGLQDVVPEMMLQTSPMRLTFGRNTSQIKYK